MSITTIARTTQGHHAGKLITKLAEDAFFMRVDNRVTPARNHEATSRSPADDRCNHVRGEHQPNPNYFRASTGGPSQGGHSQRGGGNSRGGGGGGNNSNDGSSSHGAGRRCNTPCFCLVSNSANDVFNQFTNQLWSTLGQTLAQNPSYPFDFSLSI
jgi:hypothetical protein